MRTSSTQKILELFDWKASQVFIKRSEPISFDYSSLPDKGRKWLLVFSLSLSMVLRDSSTVPKSMLCSLARIAAV